MSRIGVRWYDDKAAGTFMCCICFEQVHPDDAWVCSHGIKWDTCQQDGEREGCSHLIHDKDEEDDVVRL